MDGGKIQNVIKVYTETKHHGEYIDGDLFSIDIIRKATREKKFYTYDKNISFTVYKTKHKDKDSMIMVFSFDLPKPMSGSSAASDIVMNVVAILEKIFTPIEFMHYEKDMDSKTIYGFLKVIKFLE